MKQSPDSDRAFRAKLKEQMNDPAADRVPGSLLPENIDSLLDKAGTPSSKKVTHFPLRQVASAAAALIVVVAAAVVIPRLSDKGLSPLARNNESSQVSVGLTAFTGGASDYSGVEAVFKTLWESQLQSLDEERGWGGIFMKGENATTANDSNALPETAMPTVSQPASSIVADGMGGGDTEDYSSTNVQVDGVDEADIVKTDGKYLYCVTNRQSGWLYDDGFSPARLQIVKTEKDGKMTAVWSYIPNGYTVNEIFLADNRLVVMMTPVDADGGHIYASDGEFATVTEIYDVSTPSKPALLRTFSQEGAYDTSRLIDGKLLLISRKYTYLEAGDNQQFSFKPEELIPKVCDSTVSTQSAILPADRVYCMPSVRTTTFTIVSLIDTASQAPAESMTLLGEGTVYANNSNVYLASSVYDGDGYVYWRSADYAYSESTDIAKISISGGKPVLTATGNVKGTLCSQFAMDEYNGCLRVGTNSNSYNKKDGYRQDNNFYVLDADMKTIGSLEGLAPNENMYSVRFEGTTAYAVTYRTTDPFFVIDLSDPAHPSVTGELKIPGFSQYLHPYSDSLVIGFGMDAIESEDQSTAYTQGFKIAMFDVSDPSNPVEKSTLYIGDRGSSSDILYDHKALLFDKERNLIGIPVTITQNKTSDPLNYGDPVFTGYLLLGYSEEKGFYELGRVTHFYDDATENDYIAQSRANESVLRGVYIGNVLYTLSDNILISTDLKTFARLDRLTFFTEYEAKPAPRVSIDTPSFAASSVPKLY